MRFAASRGGRAGLRGRATIWAGATIGAAGAVAAIAMPGGATAATGAAAPRASAASKGAVSVLFAGSLEEFMEKDFGPAFEKASGYGFEGFGGGSTELAADIKGSVRQGDVFLSASPEADGELEGMGNGSWVSWYSTYATSPLELGYNPKTKFGKELAKGVPWYKVIAQKGIIVGRTEPKLDPKGRLTVEAVHAAAKKLKDPALDTALKGFPVYPETALVGRLQSGQLDAGFFYAIEAKAASFPTVPLTPIAKYAEYTATILSKDGNQAGSEALVRYLLSSQQADTLEKNGLKAIKPKFHGKASSVPKSLRSIVGAG
jgi:molybdate/tungstate transport system substrate-binding protein